MSVREVPAARLVDADALRPLVEAHAADLGTRDLAVAGSSWGKYYAARLLPGVLATLTLHGCGLDASASNVSVQLEDGVPRAVRLHDARVHEGPDVQAWTLSRLLGAHLAPVFDALHAAARVPRAVLWGSAGNYCAWLYDRLAEDAPTLPAVQADRARLLEAHAACWTRGANPLRDPVRYERLDAPGLPARVQVRRTCCLRDRIPGNAACYSCPRLTPEARIARLREAGVQ